MRPSKRNRPAVERTLHGGAVAVATGLDAVALAIVLLGRRTLAVELAAVVVHLCAVGVIWTRTEAARSARTLAAALALTLPLAGSAIAALALTTRGRGEIAQPPPDDAPAERPVTAGDVRHLTDGLAACEALVSNSADERRATLAMLTRRADAGGIALLRWAMAGPDPELAVEAALALEDLSAQFEAQVAAHVAAMAASADLETALAAADALAAGIATGLADPALLSSIAAEARRCYLVAESVAGDRRIDVALRRARLELDVLCPEAALAILAAVAGEERRDEVTVLRARAELAAHRTPHPVLQTPGGAAS